MALIKAKRGDVTHEIIDAPHVVKNYEAMGFEIVRPDSTDEGSTDPQGGNSEGGDNSPPEDPPEDPAEPVSPDADPNASGDQGQTRNRPRR